jgi:gamma-glutamyl-gamma-aminobutyrate hydrolase PuuD
MKKNNIKINFATGFDQSVIDMLNLVYTVEVCDQFDTNSDLLIFLGGSDVDPYFYKEETNESTFCDTDRDLMERQIYKYHDIKKPKLGICRGGQFLTVMNNGKLIQNIDNSHYMMHNIKTEKGIYTMTSDHHQMMYPFELQEKEYEIIGIAVDETYNEGLSVFHHNGKNENIIYPKNFVEPEIIYYPNTNSLCIQGHPEYSYCPANTVSYSLELIQNKLKL